MFTSNSYMIDKNAHIIIDSDMPFATKTVEWVTHKPGGDAWFPAIADALVTTSNSIEGSSTGTVSGSTLHFVVPHVSSVVVSTFTLISNGDVIQKQLVHEFPEVTSDSIEEDYGWEDSAWDRDTPGSVNGTESESPLRTRYILEYVPDPGVFLFTAKGFPLLYHQMTVHGTLVVDGVAVGHALGRRLDYVNIVVNGGTSKQHGMMTYVFYQFILLEELGAYPDMRLMFQIDGATFSKKIEYDGTQFVGPRHEGIDSARWSTVWLERPL